MKADNLAQIRSDRVWLTKQQCDIEEFRALVERTTSHSDYPFAAEIQKNIPVYHGADVREAVKDPATRKALLVEWVEAMATGPGVVAFKQAFADTAPIDAATRLFNEMIAEQHATGTGGGDHFAKPGANDRIWNALEKLCLRDPQTFAAYYGNDIIALIAEAWLGPAYQTTSQVNCVNPGGAAQSAHRDYHLGFQSPEVIERYPVQVHRISPVLTLQGAVAHCDMPIESGPTLYLPYSQAYLPGYLATGLPEFKAYFAEHHVQLPLEKGDAAFFNRYGQLIYREPLGRYGGYGWPQFSIHRGDLQAVLLDACKHRIGAERIFTGWRCTRVEQDAHAAIAHFVDAESNAGLPPE